MGAHWFCFRPIGCTMYGFSNAVISTTSTYIATHVGVYILVTGPGIIS